MHEPTGEYYVVRDDGASAIGPFAPREVLRTWRVASQAYEPVLAIPNFYERFKPVDLPFPLSEWLEMKPEWLEPSVTTYTLEAAWEFDWVIIPRRRRDEIVSLVNVEEAWLDPNNAIFARCDKLQNFSEHPIGSIVTCNRPVAGERVAVVEWAPEACPGYEE